MNELIVNFNNQNYTATYNEQTGYYEVNLQAPLIGGIYKANINYTDLIGQTYEEEKDIQVLAKEKIKIETNKVFMWIFDFRNFTLKDIVELPDYDINIDEETNSNSIIKILKKTEAKAQDIVFIKKNGEIIYWGIIDKIQNEDGKKSYEYTLKYITNMFDEKVETEYEEGVEDLIRTTGIEDFLQKTIEDHFIKNKDTFINRTYLEVRTLTHTKLETSITNIENGIYNLHTWMTNCTQKYDIVYNFFIENKKLIMTISKEQRNKELLNVKAQAISNYTEVFETKVISKVVVKIKDVKDRYILYLLNDRTTTEDMSNVNRAQGSTERIYVENQEDAKQSALDVFKQNSYSHMISFNMFNKYINIGTPIAIKTKDSTILDTYISAIKITQKKFIEYTCGNIRIKFIDKLLKERKD